jgi:L-cysteine/cystine lyase
VDAAALRAEFPVLERTAYLNAGTCGPVPRAALAAAHDAWATSATQGRSGPYYVRLAVERERLRRAYAERLAASPADVALTTSTSEGIVRVIEGLALGPGDEVLTAPDEHPGLLGPLLAARERRGIRIRTAPLADLADAAGTATRLVACSHVSWTTGALAPAGLRELDVPILLDGAQGAGALPVDVDALGCAFYAASGQKWLCGPVGLGMLWIAPGHREALAPTGLTYPNLERPAAGLDAVALPDARRHDAPSLPLEHVLAALAAHETLAAADWPAIHDRAAQLAARLAAALAERGRSVAPRRRGTLVSWTSAGPAAERDRLAAAGVVVRDIPGTPYVRASVGAWNDERDLERLLAALGDG